MKNCRAYSPNAPLISDCSGNNPYIQNFGVRRLDCALIPAARRRININAKIKTGACWEMPKNKEQMYSMKKIVNSDEK